LIYSSIIARILPLSLNLGTSFTAILDTDKTLDQFFQLCHAAGPDGCAYYQTSPSEIKSNFYQLVQDLIARPVPFISGSDNSTTQTYGIIDWGLLRQATFLNLFTPWLAWTSFATALAELQEYVRTRNDTSPSFSPDPLIAPLIGAPFAASSCTETCGCSADGNDTTEGKSYPELRDAYIAIACNDWPRPDPGFAFFKRELAVSEELSLLGPAWFQLKGWCTYVFISGRLALGPKC
jgi:hypothetical protein